METNSLPEIEILPGIAELCLRAAEEFTRIARQVIAAHGRFSVALSGGSTPKRLFSLLAESPIFRDRIPWHSVHFFWGDERHIPPDHADSNYRMAKEALLFKVPVPGENIHRIKAERADPNDAASEYELELRGFFPVASSEFPNLDLTLLGLGPDAHTASLFPGTQALQENKRWVAANWVAKFDSWRITLTAPVINNSRDIIFLTSGSEKAEAVRAVLGGPYQPEIYPAQLIKAPAGKVRWLLDQPAARLLGP